MARTTRSCLSWLALLALALPAAASALELRGEPVQGGLMFGEVQPGSRVTLDEREVMVSPEGRFVVGFGRDEKGPLTLSVTGPDGALQKRTFGIKPREYRIEEVDGLPQRTVTPDPADAERIKQEIALVAAARKRADERTDYATGFRWPAAGPRQGGRFFADGGFFTPSGRARTRRAPSSGTVPSRGPSSGSRTRTVWI